MGIIQQKITQLTANSPRTLRLCGLFISITLLLIGSELAALITAPQLQALVHLNPPLWHCPYPWNYRGFLLGFLLASAGGLSYFYCLNKRTTIVLITASMAIVLLSTLPFYSPLDFIDWLMQYYDSAVPATHWLAGGLILTICIITCLLIALAINLQQAKPLKATDTHGSSHWATPEEVQASGLKDIEDDNSVYVGAWQHPKTQTIHYLRSKEAEHVFAYAPTRSGKGVGLVTQTLLSYKGSKIVLDFKLENWQLTSGYNQQRDQIVLKFDPTCSDGTGARYNPLFEVRQGVNEVRDVQNIADMLVNPDGRGKSDHWSNAANSLLVSTILHVLYAERDKSLAGVRNFLADPNRSEEDTLNLMLITNHDPNNAFNWIDQTTGLKTQVHPIVASGAREMLNKSEGERTSIVSTALTFLKLYRDPVIAENTRTSDFSIMDLVCHEKPVNLYLGIPPSDIGRVMPLMRLILNQILSRLTETMDFTKGINGAVDRHPLLLMLDEFPQLGRLQFFEKALAYIAGYGIRAFIICQDLTQLQAEYGQQESIISNCHIRTAYAPNKLETAEHLSKYLGATTLTKQNISYSGNRFDLLLKNKVV